MRDNNFLYKWEAVRSKGKARYILLHGFLKFGLIMFIGLGIATPLVVSGFNTFFSPTFYIHTIALLIILSLGSTMYGISAWNENEMKYQEYKQIDK